MTGVDHIPTVAEVDQIVALADPVIRNLQITQCYHELALAMTARSGYSANWCTFATWASKQAGQTIRKQDLARILDRILHPEYIAEQVTPTFVAAAQALGSPLNQAEIQQSVVEVLSPVGALDRASLAVGRGNKKVFEEIGREFARFFSVCLDDQVFDPERLAGFCEALHAGGPPDGQDYLRDAFTHYYQVFFEADAKTRTELLLLANLEIGFHEQTRLQPEIAEAMDAAFVDNRLFRQQLINALFPSRHWLTHLRLFLRRLLNRPGAFDALLANLLAEAQRRTRLLITEYVMTIDLPPDLHLHLGSDVPAEFPDSLKHIMQPDLCSLVERFDPTPDNTRGSGAGDWAQLTDRMHFIIDLFRCYQEAPDLFDPPFAPEQIKALKMGRLPQGRL